MFKTIKIGGVFCLFCMSRGKFCLATIPCIYIYNLTISWTVLTSNLLIEKDQNTLNLNKFPPPPRSYSVLTHIVFETERGGRTIFEVRLRGVTFLKLGRGGGKG